MAAPAAGRRRRRWSVTSSAPPLAPKRPKCCPSPPPPPPTTTSSLLSGTSVMSDDASVKSSLLEDARDHPPMRVTTPTVHITATTSTTASTTTTATASNIHKDITTNDTTTSNSHEDDDEEDIFISDDDEHSSLVDIYLLQNGDTIFAPSGMPLPSGGDLFFSDDDDGSSVAAIPARVHHTGTGHPSVQQAHHDHLDGILDIEIERVIHGWSSSSDDEFVDECCFFKNNNTPVLEPGESSLQIRMMEPLPPSVIPPVTTPAKPSPSASTIIPPSSSSSKSKTAVDFTGKATKSTKAKGKGSSAKNRTTTTPLAPSFGSTFPSVSLSSSAPKLSHSSFVSASSTTPIAHHRKMPTLSTPSSSAVSAELKQLFDSLNLTPRVRSAISAYIANPLLYAPDGSVNVKKNGANNKGLGYAEIMALLSSVSGGTLKLPSPAASTTTAKMPRQAQASSSSSNAPSPSVDQKRPVTSATAPPPSITVTSPPCKPIGLEDVIDTEHVDMTPLGADSFTFSLQDASSAAYIRTRRLSRPLLDVSQALKHSCAGGMLTSCTFHISPDLKPTPFPSLILSSSSVDEMAHSLHPLSSAFSTSSTLTSIFEWEAELLPESAVGYAGVFH